uniref:Tetratricopeptide repeat protein 38 n=1 Tax=Plectus sambesii TaxID=2011161 RepID=A0A914UUI7_9BILA
MTLYNTAWKDSGLPVSTSSNEAAKLYDAVLRQYLSWSDCDALGGLEKSCKSLLEADPSFVLGRTLVLGLEVIGTGRSTRSDKEFANQLDELYADSLKSSITLREKLHARAIKQFADGLLTESCETWECILNEHPTDLLALKFVQDGYFYLGDKVGIRDSVGRVLPKWKSDLPGYSYLKGMWAFGLEECGDYDSAEKAAKEALDARRYDGWATHAMAHCFEMNGRYEEGIKFMSNTVQDWSSCNFLACHNFWHTALYHIEKKDFEEAVDIFD